MPSSFISLNTLNPEQKVIGFSGSPRKNGNSDTLLKRILSGVAQEHVESRHCNLTDIDFRGCIGCEMCRTTKICTRLTDGMSLLYPQLASSKGLVLVSPSHNYNVTSWMKAFIDRLYCFYNFENDRPRSWSSQLANQGRKAVIAGICEQENKEDMGFTIAAMRKPIEALGYEIVGELAVFRIFDKASVKHEEQTMEQAYQLGKKLAVSIQ
jgi:multimeric flavodoxin WrbA